MKEAATGSKIKRQDQYIVALLENPTLQKAAAALGISEVTLWRCTKRAEFAEAYRKARREAFRNPLPGCNMPQALQLALCCA